MKQVLVTGGSGKAGRACVRDLLEHGYEIINVDVVPPSEALCTFIAADLTDFGQALEALSGVDSRYNKVDAVVHLAAISAPGRHTNAVTFRNNILSTYNVFEAARKLRIQNLVWASSETVLGIPFDEPPPYAPLDEDYPGRPETAYSLSKCLGEEMARQFCRWDPDLKIVGLRFSNVMEPADYARFPSFDTDPQSRKWNLWGYIDARDAAQAVRRALEAPLKGAEVFIIANADTVMTRPNAELMAEFYPGVPFTREVGPNETLLSIGKAQRLLGYKPCYSWRAASAHEG
ncbi:UDP-glucose 4-epimerase [Microvirga sp. KLBC 81]|uniref:NAD-dependent epimerase/dehydratase family protein n=1 Tax=Microvirga sp. KLBC 81 TaxID=1862707 RepID=UPI000D50B24C|nr:NAD(P)-dependent oxidoreductase [Microvirga sp. KLBC 81]PVE20721.1 UDP-glucose 4-epimerase [Microvirga sp. KLBC 81]